jgi:antitoxin (DNA-binding transcriptional repressor) of toxin-antitoxin stability system
MMMITIQAVKLKENLFEYLRKIEEGETIVIRHNNQDVAFLVPPVKSDWRSRMKIQPKVLVPPEKIIEASEDIWEGITLPDKKNHNILILSKKRFAKSFYCKTALQAVFVSVSAELSQKLTGSVGFLNIFHAMLVTKDEKIKDYEVEIFWI